MVVATLPEELLALIFENFAFTAIGPLGDVLDEVNHYPEDLGDVLYDEYQGQPTTFRQYARHSGEAEILMYSVDVAESKRTLSSLCLVSKSFHRLAWPILYRGFTTRRIWDDDLKEVTSDPANFLRTICLKPEYGLALRALSIGDWDPIEAMDVHEMFDLLQNDATLVALFRWRARAFWFEEEIEDTDDDASLDFKEFLTAGVQRSLNRSLGMGLLDGHMAMLLLLCPNIQDLDISPPLDFATSTFATVLSTVLSKEFKAKSLPQHPIPDIEEEESDYIVAQMFGARWPDQKLQKPSVLQHLRSLTIRSPGISFLGIKFFKRLMSLPSLQTLRVSDLGDHMQVAIPDLDIESRCPQLRTLQLSECQLNATVLASMVKCCPNLEKLYVVWPHDQIDFDDESSADYCIEYGLITTALAQNCPNLKVLKLNSQANRANIGAKPKHPFTIGHSLDSLEKLAVLQIDAHSIYGSEYGVFGSKLADNVPKNLVALEVASRCVDHDPDNAVPAELFYRHQDRDLYDLLGDERFTRLGRLGLPGRNRSYDVDVIKGLGWEVMERGDSVGSDYDTLIHKKRLQAHGFERFAC